MVKNRRRWQRTIYRRRRVHRTQRLRRHKYSNRRRRFRAPPGYRVLGIIWRGSTPSLACHDARYRRVSAHWNGDKNLKISKKFRIPHAYLCRSILSASKRRRRFIIAVNLCAKPRWKAPEIIMYASVVTTFAAH